jgi:pimeloyl-ACP methyl ester carboxylesterase
VVLQRKATALIGLCAACSAAPERPIERKAQPPLLAATATVAEIDLPPAPCVEAALVREELRITSAPGIEIFVMKIAAPNRRGAVVLTHGAGSPSSSIWDLKPEGYSVMRKLACSGLDAYALDARGFGGSTGPAKDTMVRAQDVQADVAAVVALARQRSEVSRVDLVGWSWGSDVAALYAGAHPGEVRRLVLIAPVYDRPWPTRHSTDPQWKKIDRAEFEKYFDPKIEERAVIDDHLAQLFRFADGNGDAWLPSGPYRDLYGEDAPVWDARKIVAPVLIVRGEKDAASQEAPVARLFATLAGPVVTVTIPGEGHFPFRTKRHGALTGALLGFLAD